VGQSFQCAGTLIHADKRRYFLSNQRKSAFFCVQINFGVNHVLSTAAAYRDTMVSRHGLGLIQRLPDIFQQVILIFDPNG
jgi:hypothetical protein